MSDIVILMSFQTIFPSKGYDSTNLVCREKPGNEVVVLLIAKAEKVGKFNRIAHVQPSVFRRHNFSRRISPSWNQALTCITEIGSIKYTDACQCIELSLHNVYTSIFRLLCKAN